MNIPGLKLADAEYNRSVDRPAAILGVTVLGVIGSIVFLLLPLLIGAFTENLALTTQQVGILGSSDMAGMFVAAVVATTWIRRYNWRAIAVIACGLLILCHFLSAFVVSFTPLILIRFLAGFAGGSLMSIALTSLGDTSRPDRYFALFVAAQLTLGAMGLLFFPDLLAQFGLRGVFSTLAVVVLGASFFIAVIPQQGRVIEPRISAGGKSPDALRGFMALLACFIFNLGVMAVWAYLERMGNIAGLGAEFIGTTLAVSLVAALVGALLAAALEARFGRVLPLVFTLVVQAVALFILSGPLSENTFLIAVMLFAFAWNFPVAYQLAITVSVDEGGRLVVLFLSAVKLGYAAAPAIAASLFVLSGGFSPVIALSAIGFTGSALIFITLAILGKQQSTIGE